MHDPLDQSVFSARASRSIAEGLLEAGGPHRARRLAEETELISRVTDSVLGELKAWQHRSLDALYLIVYLDKLVVKICDEGFLRIKAVFIAVDVGVDGSKDVLGVWIQLTTACSTRRRPP